MSDHMLVTHSSTSPSADDGDWFGYTPRRPARRRVSSEWSDSEPRPVDWESLGGIQDRFSEYERKCRVELGIDPLSQPIPAWVEPIPLPSQ